MTFQCHGDTHIFMGEADICECGTAQWGNAMYIPPPLYNRHHPRQAPPPKPEASDVPLYVFKAAKGIDGATHLSADGKRVYVQMSDGVRVRFWDDESKQFGSSFPCEELPNDAVKLDA